MNTKSLQFVQVSEFNRAVLNFPKPKEISLMSVDDSIMLGVALEEEAEEHFLARTIDDKVGCVDALIDSIYFAMGGLYKMGVTEEQFEKCFSLVHQANMTKKKGVKESRKISGDPADAIKPKGWVSPEAKMKEVLGL